MTTISGWISKRNAIVLLLILSGLCQCYSQTSADGSRPQFLFPDFIQGKVRMRNGLYQYAKLNYNTVSEKMVYEKEGKLYDIVNTWMIDAVNIEDCMFIPLGDVFYQVLFISRIPLLVRHKGEILPAGTIVGYGGTSQVSNAKVMTSIKLSMGYYNQRMPSDYTVKNEKVYLIRIERKFQSFTTERQFLKLFPDKESELREFIKLNRIKFDNDSDLIKLITLCNVLYPPGNRISHN